MKITVTKIIKYKGCPIYIRKFGNVFEFIILYKNKIHTSHVVSIPQFYRVFMDEPYTEEEIKGTTIMLIETAKEVIDKLKTN